jgi:hypothetical protein
MIIKAGKTGIVWTIESEYALRLPFKLAYYEAKIREYLTVKAGWYYGEGLKPSLHTVNKALEIAHYAHSNLLDIDSTLGLSGEIKLALYRKPADRYLSISFHANSTLSNITEYKKAGEKWKRTKKLEKEFCELKNYIDNYSIEQSRDKCPTSFEYYQSAGILGNSVSLTPWLSVSSEAEYQLYVPPVLLEKEKRRAHI